MSLMNVDLTKLPWESFCCVRLFVECAPRRAVKDRRRLLTKLELEYRRRLENDLIPKDFPCKLPF